MFERKVSGFMFCFVQPRSRDNVRVPKKFLSELQIFHGQPELINKGEYTITSQVDPKVVELFFARVMGDDPTTVTAEEAKQLWELCNELGFWGFDDEIRALLGGDWRVRKDVVCVRDRVDRHDVIIEELKRRVLDLERQLLEQRGISDRVERRVEEIHSNVGEAMAGARREVGDLRKEVQQIRREVSSRASSADVAALSEQVARLKEAESKLTKQVQVAAERERREPARALDIDAVIKKILDIRGKVPGARAGITADEARQILDQVTEVFKKEPSLLELSAPITVCGDICGQVDDLIRIFNQEGYPPETQYLFLGNYVDKSYHSLETVCLLFCYKIKYPKRVFLLRGANECATSLHANRIGDYISAACGDRSRLLQALEECFKWLPFAATIGERIFCAHSGIPREIKSLDDIRGCKRPMETHDNELICGLVWNKPDEGTDGWCVNQDGVGFSFGTEPLEKFLNHFEFDVLFRGNQAVAMGFEFTLYPNQTVLTVFSAPSFKDAYANRGAVVRVGPNLECLPRPFAP